MPWVLRLSVLLVLTSACGRIAFDPQGDGGGDGGGGDPDATLTCTSDGFCAPNCGDTDPDCVTVCGDSICAGNAGELCTTCPTDCRTTADVCGNGTCGPSESSATCYVDCGPTPWPWLQAEADLLAAINQARTQGTACGGGMVTTAPAVTLDPDLVRAARDFAWEHAQFGPPSLTRCNGQGVFAYFTEVNASGVNATITNANTPAEWVATWIAGSNCPTLMNATYTLAGVAYAEGISSPYVAFLR